MKRSPPALLYQNNKTSKLFHRRLPHFTLEFQQSFGTHPAGPTRIINWLWMTISRSPYNSNMATSGFLRIASLLFVCVLAGASHTASADAQEAPTPTDSTHDIPQLNLRMYLDFKFPDEKLPNPLGLSPMPEILFGVCGRDYAIWEYREAKLLYSPAPFDPRAEEWEITYLTRQLKACLKERTSCGHVGSGILKECPLCPYPLTITFPGSSDLLRQREGIVEFARTLPKRPTKLSEKEASQLIKLWRSICDHHFQPVLEAMNKPEILDNATHGDNPNISKLRADLSLARKQMADQLVGSAARKLVLAFQDYKSELARLRSWHHAWLRGASPQIVTCRRYPYHEQHPDGLYLPAQPLLSLHRSLTPNYSREFFPDCLMEHWPELWCGVSARMFIPRTDYPLILMRMQEWKDSLQLSQRKP